MDRTELMRRIRRIDLISRRIVQGGMAGAYQSVFKGQGLSFASVRPYMPGDDVRTIDWKVTARTGVPHIKEYEEERELTVMLVIDGSPSVFFGTRDRQKRDHAAELGATIAYAANSNNDRSGLIVFSDHVEHHIPPAKGSKHIMRMILDIVTLETKGQGSDLAQALRTINRTLPTGTLVFLLSDFMMPSESYSRELAVTSRQYETIAIVLSDPIEDEMPDVGVIALRDAETNEVRWVDTSSARWRQEFHQKRRAMIEQRDYVIRRSGATRIDAPPDGDYVRALERFFRRQAMGG